MSEPDTSACPICRRSVKTSRMQKLYEMPVCRKCRNAFANRRQAAYVLDGFCFWIVSLIFAGVLLQIAYFASPQLMEGFDRAVDDEDPAAVACFFVYNWILMPMAFCLKDGFRGQSPGKWLCGVRVVDQETFEPISFGSSFKRNLPLLIPVIPLIVALQLIKGFRTGDKWARTRVLQKKYAHQPPFDIRGLLCTKCGYNLTGNVSGRCPECGQTIPMAVPLAAAIPSAITS